MYAYDGRALTYGVIKHRIVVEIGERWLRRDRLIILTGVIKRFRGFAEIRDKVGHKRVRLQFLLQLLRQFCLKPRNSRVRRVRDSGYARRLIRVGLGARRTVAVVQAVVVVVYGRVQVIPLHLVLLNHQILHSLLVFEVHAQRIARAQQAEPDFSTLLIPVRSQEIYLILGERRHRD